MREPARPPDDPGTARLPDPLEYERRFWSRGLLGVAGVDEVGRGPLAGPVFAAAVVLPEGALIEGATDSKALGAAEREELSQLILARAQFATLGAASVREIDRANILVATAWAMNRALGRMPREPDHVVVDGLPMKSLRWKHEAVVGGMRSCIRWRALRSWRRCAGIDSWPSWLGVTPDMDGIATWGTVRRNTVTPWTDSELRHTTGRASWVFNTGWSCSPPYRGAVGLASSPKTSSICSQPTLMRKSLRRP